MLDDPTLLRRYADERSEAAFAELVARHLPLVYTAAARRLSGDAHRAQDVAQLVFCALARDAHRLSRHATLTGWLYTTTRNAVVDVVRSERSRQAREKEAHAMQEISSDPEAADWSRLKPVLDDALDHLAATDREAVLLRFFQGRAFAEIGAALGLSEDTARKRVERALDKLRDALRRRGLASTSGALGVLLAAEEAAAVPIGVAQTVTAAALASGGATALGAAGLFMATKLQIGMTAVVVVGGIAGLLTQQLTIAELRETTAANQQQIVQLSAEKAELARLRNAASAEPAQSRAAGTAQSSTAPITPRQAPRSVPVPVLQVTPASALANLPDTPENRAERERLFNRYGPFLRERGLTPVQIDRFIELQMHQNAARNDLQAAVRDAGAKGSDPAIEAMRRQLYEPLLSEMRSMLGEDGYKDYINHEKNSFYHLSYVEPVQKTLAGEGSPLSPQQAESLRQLVVANHRVTRVNPTDISQRSSVDWDAIIAGSGAFLTPAQIELLKIYVSQRR